MSKDFRKRLNVKFRDLNRPYGKGVANFMKFYLFQLMLFQEAGKELPVGTRLAGFGLSGQEVMVRVVRIKLFDDIHE